MNKALVWLIAAALLLIALAVYRSGGSSDRLKVDPDAAREIERAKRR